MNYPEVYHHKNETMLSVYRQGQGRTGRHFLQLFQNLMRRACLLLLLAATALGAGAQSKIAFSSTRDGNSEIYVMNPDSTGQTNLTNNAANDDFPAFSSDGSKIVFSSNRGQGDYQIYVMNADGTGLSRLTYNSYYNYIYPVFSPDGSKIAFTSVVEPKPSSIHIMNANGTGQTFLTMGTQPSFSPDGSKIVFAAGGGIYVMNADGTSQTLLASNGYSPSFSPDGSKIVFYSDFVIYVMNADGTGQTRLTNTASNRDPVFSPDGSQIAFASNANWAREIYVMNADGTGQTNLTNSGAWNNSPSWGIVPLDGDGDGVPDFRDCAPADKTKWRTGTFYTDADGDTYTVGSGTTVCYGADTPTGYSATKSATDDCDDNNAAINPATVWYKDADNDGYSDANTLTQCERPANYKLASELTATTVDCDDNNATINPATLWYKDADNDGYSDGTTATQCERPTDYTLASELTATTGDCDDTNGSLNLATVWYKDSDNDGYSDGTAKTQCTKPAGYKRSTELTTTSGDCNDDDVAINPKTLWVLDNDKDGYYFGNPVMQCSSPGTGYVIKVSQQAGDCSDNNAGINPGAVEVCGNGVDDNCNGKVDEAGCTLCANGTGLTTTNITSSGATLKWIALANPVQWEIEYKKVSTGSKWTTITLPGYLRSYTISSLSANQNYNWHIRAKCNKTWTAFSNTISFKTSSTQQTNSTITQARPLNVTEEESPSLKLYPNPNKGRFMIELHLAGNINAKAGIEMINVMGQTVSAENTNISNGLLQKKVSISSSLSSGIYIVRVVANNKMYLARLVYEK